MLLSVQRWIMPTTKMFCAPNTGAEDGGSGLIPWCSWSPRQQSKESLHQHPSLWVTMLLTIAFKFPSRQLVDAHAPCQMNFSPQMISAVWSWSPCTTMKEPTTSTPITFLWVSFVLTLYEGDSAPMTKSKDQQWTVCSVHDDCYSTR